MDQSAHKLHGLGNRWRLAGWSCAAALLLAPWIAKQVTHEVNWTAVDFVAFGAMLGSVGGAFELLVWRANGVAYRVGAAVALVTAFLLVWVNLAVGIIGREDNPANAMFAGVLAIGAAGAVLGRLSPAGMARAMQVTAVAQAFVGLVALVGGLGAGSAAWPWDVAVATAVFAALWLVSATLFARAARRPASAA